MEKLASASGTSIEVILADINDTGIYYWNENLKLVTSFENLNLPDVLKIRNDMLQRYCELRIDRYTLLYKAIEQDTEEYDDELDGYDQKIDAVINALTKAK